MPTAPRPASLTPMQSRAQRWFDLTRHGQLVAMVCLLMSCPMALWAETMESPLAKFLTDPRAKDARFRLMLLSSGLSQVPPATDPDVQSTIRILTDSLSPAELPAAESRRPTEYDYTSFIGSATKYLLTAPIPNEKQDLIAFVTSCFRFIGSMPEDRLKDLLALCRRDGVPDQIIHDLAKDYLTKTPFKRMEDCRRIAHLATIKQLRPMIWESLRTALISPDVQNSIRMLSLLELRTVEQHDIDLLAVQTMLNTLDQAEPAPLLVKHRIEKPRLGAQFPANDQTRELITAIAQGKGVYPAQIRALSLLVALGLEDSNFAGLQSTMLKAALTWRKEHKQPTDYLTIFTLNDLLLICCLPEDFHEDPLLLSLLDDHFERLPEFTGEMSIIATPEVPFYPYLRRRLVPENTPEGTGLGPYRTASEYWFLRGLSNDSLVEITPMEQRLDEQIKKTNRDPLLSLEMYPNLRESNTILRDGLKAGRHAIVASKVFLRLPYFTKAYGRDFVREILTDATSTGNFNATLIATETFLLAGDQPMAQQMARRLEPLRPELTRFDGWTLMTYLRLALIFRHLGMSDTWVDHTLKQSEAEAPDLVAACRSLSEKILSADNVQLEERHLQTYFKQSSGGLFSTIGRWQVILKKRIIPTGLSTVRIINGLSLSDQQKQNARNAFGAFLGCRAYEPPASP